MALASLLASMLLLSAVDARGYYGQRAKEKSQHLNMTDPAYNDVTKMADSKMAAESKMSSKARERSREENSVERSPLLLDRGEPAALPRFGEQDVQGQLLMQLGEIENELSAMRRALSNLKYQGHLQYKMMKRWQEAASATAARCDGQPHNMIRTAALRMEPSDAPQDAGAAPRRCPEDFDWNPETSSCYLFASERVTWRMAREKCLARDAALVAIETNREQRFIVDTARGRSDIRHCNFWTGATDEGSEGRWYWAHSGRPLSYSAWNHDEPNNGAGDEHCMHMLWVFGWSWNDARCNYDSACYICEIHLKGAGGSRRKSGE